MIEIILLSALTTLLILPTVASAATTAELENAPLEKTILEWSFLFYKCEYLQAQGHIYPQI